MIWIMSKKDLPRSKQKDRDEKKAGSEDILGDAGCVIKHK